MRRCLLVLLASVLYAADINVGVDYPDIQAAFDHAPCGSRILIPPGVYLGPANMYFAFRQNCADHPMTVTTTMHSWLPAPGTRITPSYIYGAGGPLLPRLQGYSLGNYPALVSGLNGANAPANGWTFQGIVFEPSSPGNSASQLCPKGANFNAIVNVGGQQWPYVASGPSQQPDNIVFDRVIVRSGAGRSDTTVCVVCGIRIATRGLTIKNSYISDIVHEYQDSYAIGASSGASNVTIYNNYLNAATESGLITSGGPGDYPDPQYKNYRITHNYWVKSYKWWGGDVGCQSYAAHCNNPHGPVLAARTNDDWVTGYGVELPSTMKNLIEFKSINGAMVRYNVGDFSPGVYMGQYFGMCATPRSSDQIYYPNKKDAKGTTYSLTTSGTSFSWTGNTVAFPTWDSNNKLIGGLNWPMRVGDGVCLVSRTPGSTTDANHSVECRKIATVDNAAKTGTVTNAWTTNTTTGWWATLQDNAWFKDVTFESNVFKNVATPWQYLLQTWATDDARARGAGRIRNYVIRNNLTWNTLKFGNSFGAQMTLNEEADANPGADQSRSGVGHVFSNNTEYRSPSASRAGLTWSIASASDSTPSYIPKVQGFVMTNNIFADSYWGMTGQSLFGTPAPTLLNFLFQPDYVARNNQLYGQYGSFANGLCTGTCGGNISTPSNAANYVNAASGQFKIKPGTAWAKAGTDGRDLGADYDLLPLLKNVRVAAGSREAVIEFDVSATNKDIPVVLEVSSTTNAFGGTIAYPCLTSTLCPYVVLPSLDPTLFKQPDSSERINAKLPPVAHDGLHRSWPVCWRETVADERSGTPRDLSCLPNTTYYYRLMAGGDTVWGKFTTKAASSSDAFSVQRMPAAGAESLRLNWGSFWSALNGQTVASGSPGHPATATVTGFPGQSLWVQIHRVDSSGAVLATEPVRLIPR